MSSFISRRAAQCRVCPLGRTQDRNSTISFKFESWREDSSPLLWSVLPSDYHYYIIIIDHLLYRLMLLVEVLCVELYSVFCCQKRYVLKALHHIVSSLASGLCLVQV